MRTQSYFLIFIICLFFGVQPISGQSLLNQPQERTASSDTVKNVPNPIPLGDINNASSRSFNLFTRVGEQVLGKNLRTELSAQTDTIISKTTNFFRDTAGVDFSNLNFRELEIVNNSIRLLRSDIANVQRRIDGRLVILQSNENEVRQNRQRWTLTLSRSANEEIPPALRRRIQGVISKSDSVLNILQENSDFLLVLSDRVTGQQIRLDQFESELEEYSKFSSSLVFRRDMPPIWRVFSGYGSSDVSGQWALFRDNLGDDTAVLMGDSVNRLVLVFCIFILLFIVVFWLRATVTGHKIKWKNVILSLYVNEIFKKPVEVSLLIGIYLIFLIIPDLPTSFGSILSLITVYAILRLAYEILPPGYRGFLLGFSIAYILFRFYNLFYDQLILSRFLLLASQVIALSYSIRYLYSRRLIHSQKRKSFTTILSSLAVIYVIFLAVGVIGNIAGTVSFSEFLTGGVIRSGFLILTTFVGFHISAALFYLILNSNLFKGSNIIKKQGSYIFSRIFRLLRLFFIVSWLYIALGYFKVQDIILEWLTGILTNEISIGKATIALIDIILFLFVIWLSIVISKFIRHILNEEVFPRVKVERGMPGTIIMLLRITVISIGFFLAAAAAGMELSNLTIIIGAFSVGIGFGLQNIFNNLVSGLILAFERPIKEGDIVELNTFLGTVKKIGIRSSIVRTFSGSEVIVPNGELISKELINWTLSDQFRRVDLRAGVAYGTNPDQVIEILMEVAKGNPRVNEEPAPRAYFIDFGESSLDFRLLAWVDQDYRLEVESEMRVEINRKLKEAGIEIPFPQRDLHIRSADPKAGKNLKG